ncbi:MAG: hypothetical protein GY803_19435 [Chloroflexi bacterium]|nr:hypothetical protein [Chloroflexota bacterium]
MNKKTPQSRQWQTWLAGAVVIILLAGGVWLIRNRDSSPEPESVPPTSQVNLPVGPTTTCQAVPRFVAGLGFAIPALNTSFPDYVGLAVGNYDEAGNVIDVYQRPSWDDAGYLGPITRDRDGHVYVSPVPKVSLDQNPLEEQNQVYRIDSDTGAMTAFIDLPAAQPIAASNPFGTIGLTYDCDTHSMYATTLAGSTAQEEVGRIYRINLNTGQAVNQLDNVDAIGIGVFNGLTGKRLYYGSARTPDVYSIALTKQGDFVGEVRHEFSLALLENGGQEKARRISFTQDSLMQVSAVDFNFSLQAAIESQQVHYRLRYLPGDTWELLEVVR